MNRVAVLMIVSGAVWSAGVSAQSMNTEAEDSARAVMNRFGSGEALQTQGAMPLSTDAQMTTVDGATNFGAKVACRDSEEFLRVTMLPSGAMDIDQLVVEVDMDMDGTRETVSNIPGPFAGVCINGMVRCDAGTFNNCQMMQWRATAAGVGLIPSTTRDVGSCYCFNGSCGSNLLLVNNQKILNDISSGVAQSMIEVQPRLVIGRTALVDPMSVTQYGQLAACGTDNEPEQYYTNAAALPAAGRAAAADPNSPASLLSSTTLMMEHGMTEGRCVMDRVINVDDLTADQIIAFGAATAGSGNSCGPGCVDFVVGTIGDNYYGAGRCTTVEQYLGIDVLRPDRITNVSLTGAGWDDAQHLDIDNAVVWTSDGAWMTPGPYPRARCDYRTNYRTALSQDVTGAFANVGRTHLRLRTAIEGGGEGWLTLRATVQDGCSIRNEEIVNGCESYEANPECSVMTETVDGVATVTNYLTTGLAPLPTDRAIGPPSCALTSGPRPWWRTERVYSCRTGTPSYDGRAARRRADIVQGSVDMTSGAYTDEREIDGARVRSDETILMPTAPYAPRPRTMVCKTVRPRPGIEIADGQAVNNLNTTGPANDFSFKECDDSGVCPLEPGETLVSGCAVNSNFAQAATMMQTVRLIGQDTQCVAP